MTELNKVVRIVQFIVRFALSKTRVCYLVSFGLSTGKDCNAALRFRKLFQTKEECTKGYEVSRWHLLETLVTLDVSCQTKERLKKRIGQK
jgi:hypothetical protein